MKGVCRSYKTGCILNNFSIKFYTTDLRSTCGHESLTPGWDYALCLSQLKSVDFQGRAFLNVAMGSVSSQRPPF